MAQMRTFSVKNFEKFQHYKDRAPPWIKLYNGLLEDYEFGGLPDASKMHLIAIWLLASRSDNKIPFDPKWVSNRINATEPVDLALLAKRGFIIVDQGEEPSDSKPLAECLSRGEGQVQDIEKRKADTRLVADATQPSPSEFEEFWKAYPRRDGPNPRKPAEQKFNALAKTGVDPDVMIQAAKSLAVEESRRGKVGTQFIPQAITWLNQQRWSDHAATAFTADDGLIEVLDQLQLEAWDAYGIQHNGRGYPRNKKGGWRFPSKWPPGYEANLVAGVEKLLAGKGIQ
jgi:hypothetical protein